MDAKESSKLNNCNHAYLVSGKTHPSNSGISHLIHKS